VTTTVNEPDLREIVNYHAHDDAWVPDMLAGRTMDEAGRGKFDGDLPGEDPRARFALIVEKACAVGPRARRPRPAATAGRLEPDLRSTQSQPEPRCMRDHGECALGTRVAAWRRTRGRRPLRPRPVGLATPYFFAASK
jgi:hypothetical protein